MENWLSSTNKTFFPYIADIVIVEVIHSNDIGYI